MSASATETSTSTHDSEPDASPPREDSVPSKSDPSDSEPAETAKVADDDVELAPPLPDEAPPDSAQDDGWDPVWDENAQAFYFFNRFTNISQWNNPRVPTHTEPAPPGVGNYDRIDLTARWNGEPPSTASVSQRTGGYDPAIHGDYDPDADYAKAYEDPGAGDSTGIEGTEPADPYAAMGAFNRLTGRWQAATVNPENFNDENKSRRQMTAYFDVDAAANSHDGRSLKAERSSKKLSKKEVKAFKDKRRERKEEKRRAWLRD